MMLSIPGLSQGHSHGADKTQQIPPQPASFDAALVEGKQQRDNGHFTEAAETFLQAATIAHAAGDAVHEARALVRASACQIKAFQYRAALQSSETAYALAMSAKASAEAGSAAGNLATIYTQAGDLSQAQHEAEESVRLLEQSSRKDLFAQGLFVLASIHFRLGDSAGGQTLTSRAIAVAQGANLPMLEAMAWDMSGISLLVEISSANSAALDQVQQALGKAASIRLRLKDPDLALTNEHLAELALKRQNYPEALRLIDLAFASHSTTFDYSPLFYPVHVRGQILLGLGRKTEALAEFKRAVAYADQFWEGALPGDVTSTQTLVSLNSVYQDYVSLAASEALRTHDQALSREAWEALASSRAASLRQQVTVAFAQDFRLPPRYFDLVSKLQTLQARSTLGQNSKEDRAQLQQARLDLSSLRNQIGFESRNYSPKKEISTYRTTLKDIQARLNDSEVLLSFSLGDRQSYLWAVTRDRVNLYNLAPQLEIQKRARAFSKSVQSGENSQSISRQFASDLFGQLTESAWRKRDWLVAADGPLLDSVPFSAMQDPRAGASANRLLIEQHSLRFLPSELLIASPKAAKSSGRFVGIADPIYNLADSRFSHAVTLLPASTNAAPSVSLARLVESDREVRLSAENSGMSQVQILSGAAASSVHLSAALANKPELIHFAVHVVSPQGRPQDAALALSLTRDNLPELLTPEVIASYRVPGSLVVLSGCASEQGQTLPSAGLIGLSRAWLLAGASAVIVSAWPTPDDSGTFFSSFYKHLNPTNPKKVNKALSIAERASVALKETQLEMQRASDYRSAPEFWAAYSIISKE